MIFSICIKSEFETNLKFYFITYNTKNKILRLNILFVGYMYQIRICVLIKKIVFLRYRYQIGI